MPIEKAFVTYREDMARGTFVSSTWGSWRM